MNISVLHEHYNNILSSNRDKILAGGTGDLYLSNAENDNRMALVLLIRISAEISEKIEDRIKSLKEIEPDMYYYPSSDFHIAVMDILKGKENRTVPGNISEYISCISECASHISPFNISLDGLVASDNAIIVQGFYDDELLKFREDLRKSFSDNGLLLEERYKTISSHVTIARLKDHYQNPEKLLSFIDEPCEFGKIKIDKMELSFHNWYDTRKEVLYKIDLQ